MPPSNARPTLKTVISCSRRTDVPAWYLNWLKERIRERWVDVPNPFTKTSYRVNLDPESVHTIVLWSKNFGKFLGDDSFLRDYRLFFHFTLNDCPDWEPRIPDLSIRLDQLRELARRYGPDRINWRFDPIVFQRGGKLDNLGRFEKIARAAADVGIRRCIFSFTTWYEKVLRRPGVQAMDPYDPSVEKRRETVERLSAIARPLGITLHSCCVEGLDGIAGVEKGSCIDGRLLSELAGERCSLSRDTSQRKSCGCTISKDVGSYEQPCYNSCLYCYANPAQYTPETESEE